MTDTHCHIAGSNAEVKELLIGRDFVGLHPWEVDALSEAELTRKLDELHDFLLVHPDIGVGEIGLDRLKAKTISDKMYYAFDRQLEIASKLHRNVVLHGAKCWGRVWSEWIKKNCGAKVLLHGFSRSDGLIPDIVEKGGYISVGPSILNDHAVNYRAMVKKIPLSNLLVETDRTIENAASCPSIDKVLSELARLLGIDATELERITDSNAACFSALSSAF